MDPIVIGPEKTQTEINREIHEALYGHDGQPGLVQNMDNVTQILSAFRLFGRAIMWIALVMGSVGAAWTAFWPEVKRLIIGK